MTSELQNFINTVISIDKKLNNEIEAILISDVDDLETNNVCPIIVTANCSSYKLYAAVKVATANTPFIPEWQWMNECFPKAATILWKREA